MKDTFDIKKFLTENSLTTQSRMRAGTPVFYAPSYLKKKYPNNYKEIEEDIDEMGPNAWNLFTSLESPEEVEDFIQGLTEDSSTVKEVEEIPNVPPTIEEEVESEYMTGAYDFMMFAAENLDNPEIEDIWDTFNNEYGDGSETNMEDEDDPIGDAEADHYDSMDRMGYRT